MVACFLDGDGCIFDRSLIKKGRDGGREAALALRSNITNYAERQGIQGELTVVVTLFLSKYGLAKALQVSLSPSLLSLSTELSILISFGFRQIEQWDRR